MTDKATIIKQTQKFIARGQYDKAIMMWSEFVSGKPNANIFNIIGDLYLKINKRQSAIEWFHKSATLFREEGFSPRALAIYKKILNIDPSEADALLALGELNEEKGLVPDAIKFYLASVDALNKKGRKDELLNIYNRILDIAPSNLPLRNKIAEYYIKEGFNHEASKELIYIARFYEEKGESEQAADYFNKAVELFPQNSDAYLSMSKLYHTLGKTEEAATVLKKAIKAFPDDVDLNIRISGQLIENGKLEEAEELLNRISGKEPDNAYIKEQVAYIHLSKGDKEKAWAIYSPIIDKLLETKKPGKLIEVLKELYDEDPIEVSKKLAYLYKKEGDHENTLLELIKAGELLKNSGMKDEAVSILNEAKKVDPENEKVNRLIMELREETGVEQAPVESEKSMEEAITEAEILLRYGKTGEAMKLLESLKTREPENMEVHNKLKSLYLETGEKELAVTECIILANLYKKADNPGMNEQLLNEAFNIDPDDPRLAERSAATISEKSTLSTSAAEKLPVETEGYEEDISEADFYFRQGLHSEALEIYQRLSEAMPGNQEIQNKINKIQHTEETEMVKEPVEETAMEVSAGDESVYDATAETLEDILLEGEEEIPEPSLENDVLEIFQEFKKGIETQLEEEDSETHYNLGIAYKEMGLLDDAIKEFQTASKDNSKTVQASSMLGLCYIEKELYPLAIDSLKKVLDNIIERDDAYWGTKYDLASAYEKNGNIKKATELFTEIYSNNAKFRKVDEKLNTLKGSSAAKTEAPTPAKKKKERISYI